MVIDTSHIYKFRTESPSLDWQIDSEYSSLPIGTGRSELVMAHLYGVGDAELQPDVILLAPSLYSTKTFLSIWE